MCACGVEKILGVFLVLYFNKKHKSCWLSVAPISRTTLRHGHYSDVKRNISGVVHGRSMRRITCLVIVHASTISFSRHKCDPTVEKLAAGPSSGNLERSEANGRSDTTCISFHFASERESVETQGRAACSQKSRSGRKPYCCAYQGRGTVMLS